MTAWAAPVPHVPAPQKRDPARTLPTETYGIVAQAHAHEGSIFALCLRRDGTVLSGGGRDRRLVQWGPGLVALQEAEVRPGPGTEEGGGRGMVSGALTFCHHPADSGTLWGRAGHRRGAWL